MNFKKKKEKNVVMLSGRKNKRKNKTTRKEKKIQKEKEAKTLIGCWYSTKQETVR